ncbi:MAG TPA: DNA repair protein RecN [Nitrospiraceae bacterium]
MLAELRIANFALIEQLNLQFQPGYTVLTGETGAGKSLLIDAIGLLVGGRASADQIRSGEEEAILEAAFQLTSPHPLLEQLRAKGLVGADDTELILRRVLSRSGRHRVFVNGSLCPLRTLEELGGTLVDILGQHEQQSLLSHGAQLEALDAFGRTLDLRARYQQAYQTWNDLRVQAAVVQAEAADRAQRAELLRFQHQEIEQAGLQPGEDEILQTERQRLVHARRLGELAQAAYEGLQGDEQGVLSHLTRVVRALSDLVHTDVSMQDCQQAATEAMIQLKDLAGQLRDYTENLESDPSRQTAVEDRLDLIQRLKKKYGGSIVTVVEFGERVKGELEAIATHNDTMAVLTAKVEEARESLWELALQLSKKRAEAAKRMKTFVKEELAVLKMDQAAFDIVVTSAEAIESAGPSGRDDVEFLISTNRGEPLKPLARVASGGELSRVMLALKTILAEMDQVPVLVFDEVDSGVGGAVAAAMGTRLRRLGAFHQVFCITHLPQVASQADHHLVVEKEQNRKRTTASVRTLTGIGREAEIARMLGGETVTQKVRATAAELLSETKPRR